MTGLEQFRELVGDGRPALGEGCLLIASHIGGADAVAEGRARLDRLAAAVVEAHGPSPDVALVVEHLVERVGFHGDRSDYGAVRNSLLPEVLRLRRGIPITLAVVVIEVCGRLGSRAVGVGMPGHFLVGDGPRPERWFDPFGGSAALDARGAETRFRSVHGSGATFDPAFLRPTPPAQILARVLNNLANALRSLGDPTGLVRALELRDAIPGVRESPRARVELAEALASVGRVSDAAALLDDLSDRVDPRRRSGVEARVAQLRATLN
ncbi:MAG: transglutaminase-like domain-containing protein [Acidimicrobiales bacterium]|nr:transglutaminase family protein [Acidimicrobiales bacterium]